MTGTRFAAVAALTLALALPATGCGGDDDADQFREGYNAAVDELGKVNTEIGQAAGGAAGQTNAKIAKEFDSIADTAEKARADLAELEPPQDARDEFDKLLSALGRGVADLRAVADAARSNSPEEASKAVQDLTQTGQEITEAEDALKKAVDG